MQLKSTAFADGAAIPRRFTCDGENVSPPLAWDDVPSGTRSFALICNDPDAPAGVWHHWAAYDLPSNYKLLAENAGRPAPNGPFKQAINDFGKVGYGGPCPPRRHGPHHYEFRLLALSIEHLSVSGDPQCRDVEREARKYIIAEKTLVGLYER